MKERYCDSQHGMLLFFYLERSKEGDWNGSSDYVRSMVMATQQ